MALATERLGATRRCAADWQCRTSGRRDSSTWWWFRRSATSCPRPSSTGWSGRVGSSLATDGVVVLCHWRHPIEGWPLDGAQVHAAFREADLPPAGGDLSGPGRGDRRARGAGPVARPPAMSGLDASTWSYPHVTRSSSSAGALTRSRGPAKPSRSRVPTWRCASRSSSIAARTRRPRSSGAPAGSRRSRSWRSRSVPPARLGCSTPPAWCRRSRQTGRGWPAPTRTAPFPFAWLAGQARAAEEGYAARIGTVLPDLEFTEPLLYQRWLDRHDLGPGHPHVHGANLGVSLAAYRAVGGFTHRECGEDVHLVSRLRRAGLSALVTADDPVDHVRSSPQPGARAVSPTTCSISRSNQRRDSQPWCVVVTEWADSRDLHRRNWMP